MTAVGTAMTAEQYDALPREEGRNQELLDGELIEVSSATPRHNRILAQLTTSLNSFANARQLGAVLPETDLAIRKDSRLRPDFCFFSAKTWSKVDIDRVPIAQTPEIAAEIVSPSESATTLQRKIEAYLAWGVAEIWLIYPETRTFMVHTAVGARRFSGRINERSLLSCAHVPGWELQIADLFEKL
jgi:Uma2 family endonuclease